MHVYIYIYYFMLYVLHRYIKPIMYIIKMILCLRSKQIHMETHMRKYWMKEMEVQIKVILHDFAHSVCSSCC